MNRIVTTGLRNSTHLTLCMSSASFIACANYSDFNVEHSERGSAENVFFFPQLISKNQAIRSTLRTQYEMTKKIRHSVLRKLSRLKQRFL